MIHDYKMMKTISDRLASLSDLLHKTDQEIADTMGVTLRTFRKYCREPVKLRVEYAVNLVNAYPITLEYLVGDTDFPYVMTQEIKKFIEVLSTLSQEETKELFEQFQKVDDEGKQQLVDELFKL